MLVVVGGKEKVETDRQNRCGQSDTLLCSKNGNQNQKMDMALEKKLVVWAEINGRFVYICHVIRAQMML